MDALNWETSSQSLYIIIIPPPLSPFPPFLLPPSQRPTRWCRQVWSWGATMATVTQVVRWVHGPSHDNLSIYLPPSLPPSALPPLLSFPSPSVYSGHITSPFPPPPPPPTFSLLFFTHDHCTKNLGCCQPACIRLYRSCSKWSWRVK